MDEKLMVKVRDYMVDTNKFNDMVKEKLQNSEFKTYLSKTIDASLSLIDELVRVIEKDQEEIKIAQKFNEYKGKGRAKKKIDDTKLIALKKMKISNKKIGAVLNVSEATIRRRLKELNNETNIQKSDAFKLRRLEND